MERVKILVETRDKTGKEFVKKMRKQGNIPGVVYSKTMNLPVYLTHPNLMVLKKINFSESAIIDIDIQGEKKGESLSVVIKDVQYNPLTEAVMHLDFLQVSLTEKIKVHVPIVLKGEAPGVKEGGVLEQILREVEIEALPLDIPQSIEVDISALTIGHSIHVKDIAAVEKVKIITHADDTIAAMVAKKEEEEVSAEDAAAAAGAGAEPEVIKEKKTEAAALEEKK